MRMQMFAVGTRPLVSSWPPVAGAARLTAAITVVAALVLAGGQAPAAFASLVVAAHMASHRPCPIASVARLLRTLCALGSQKIGSYLRATVSSPVSHKTYTVTYRLSRGTVQAWANGKDSRIRFLYAN
jgi:hypothetical protein